MIYSVAFQPIIKQVEIKSTSVSALYREVVYIYLNA